MNSRTFSLSRCALGFLGAGALSLSAHGAPPVVKTVPWVAARPLVPHTTYPGRVVRLKGAADVQGVNFQYVWDFGDGSAPATGTVSNKDVIEASHAYVGPLGQIWTARLTVNNTSTGESSNRAYYVEMKAKALATEANVALDEGLWYLHKTMNRMTAACGGLDCGAWNSTGYAASGYHGVTAANANAFMVNGHHEAGPADNPYADTVGRAMRFLFTQLAVRSIGPQPDNVNGGSFNPDVNGNGLGIANPQNEAYQSGMLLSAIVASGTPNAIAPTGPANVIGRRYLDIVQDMVDNIAYCQYDAGLGGGWYYTCNGYDDNSISQWMAIGLLGAREFGAQWPLRGGAPKPNVVPEWNKVWLANSQMPPNPPFFTNGGGYFGYQSTSPAWGPYATTASGMVQLVMDGIGRGPVTDTTMPNWNGAETFMRENWDNQGLPVNSIKNYYYGLFSFTKAMLLHDPIGSGVPSPIKCLTSSRPGTSRPPIDWYGAELGKVDACSGNPPTSSGVARTLIDGQNPIDGYWTGHNNSADQFPFETAWAIMMLNRTVFESGVPVAVAQVVPNPAVAGQVVTLDGADSFHQDAARKIAGWQWDFDSDGVWDASGPVVTRSFPALGSYPVTLKVTDDGTPPKAATTLVMVQVSIPPLPPTANANGPYNFCPAVARWFLDGSGSVNPDQGQHQPGNYPGDTIRSYAWDLDGSGQFSGASGPQPDVKAYFGPRGPGSYLVQLKVTDSTSLSYPASGLGDLSSVASTVVNVKSAGDAACSCIGDLAARAKAGKIQLTWTNAAGAAGYNVYRGTVNGGPYVKIGSTTSTYSTLLDATVVNGTTYFYVVRPTAANADEQCQSNQASATAAGR